MSENTEDKTKKLVERALRQKTGINERLLCMRLIQATFSTDIGSIVSNVCMAASMVEQGYPNKLDGFDFKKFRIIKKIYRDLNNSEITQFETDEKQKHRYEKIRFLAYPIPWSIDQNEEVYSDYIKPWCPTLIYNGSGIILHRKGQVTIKHKKRFNFCGKVLMIVESDSRYSEEVKKEEKKLLGETCPFCRKKIEHEYHLDTIEENIIFAEPEWSFFFEATHVLTDSGFKILHTAFGEWARDECGKAIMVMGGLVSQGIYDDVLKQLKGGYEEPEEKQKRG